MNRLIFTSLILILINSGFLHAEVKKIKHKHAKDDVHKCVECHDMGKGRKYFHKPVQAGLCTNCHSLYNNNEKLLMAKNSPKLCTMCHTGKEKIIQENKNVHPAIKINCTGCHDPHSGDRQFRLKHDKRKDLCLSCHTEKKEWISKVKNKHGAIYLEDGGCFACHDPHGTTRPKMLRVDSTKELCLSCHNKPLKRDEDGVMLMNMAKHLKENEKWHGPIVAGECTGCHNPHGSNNRRMLKGPYPTTPTAKFKPESYVCFICHDSEKITEASTTTFTNFRKDKKNLHTVHVKTSSIVCGTCHDFHGVKDPIPLLKDKTNYGAAQFRLRYKKAADGGSCNPICHEKREYKRGSVEPKP